VGWLTRPLRAPPALPVSAGLGPSPFTPVRTACRP